MEASPLLISSDLSGLTAREVAALRNPHLIAVDQSGQQRQIADGPIWAVIKSDPEGGSAILLLNTGTATTVGNFTLAQLGFTSQSLKVTDVWTGQVQTRTAFSYTLEADATELMEVEAQ